jgi:hypothetical protein
LVPDAFSSNTVATPDLGLSASVANWGYPPIMKARQLIDGASFGPDALKAIGRAFDEAWARIAANFGNDPNDIERARYRLATAMLSVAKEESRDVEALKRAALEAMALGYRNRPRPRPKISGLRQLPQRGQQVHPHAFDPRARHRDPHNN